MPDGCSWWALRDVLLHGFWGSGLLGAGAGGGVTRVRRTSTEPMPPARHSRRTPVSVGVTRKASTGAREGPAGTRAAGEGVAARPEALRTRRAVGQGDATGGLGGDG